MYKGIKKELFSNDFKMSISAGSSKQKLAGIDGFFTRDGSAAISLQFLIVLYDKFWRGDYTLHEQDYTR